MTGGPSDVDGVASQIYVPAASTLVGLNYSASGGDVFVGYASSWVQLGWVDHSDGTQWFWYGESLPSGRENISDFSQLSPGWHSFKIFRIETGALRGYMQFYVDNVFQLTSQYTHAWGPPGFNGEVSSTCTQMDGWAQRNPSPPNLTLWYSRAADGWHPWIADYRNTSNNKVFTSLSSGGTGTDFASGGHP